MDVRVRDLAGRQYDLVARWQLLAAGATSEMVRHWTKVGRWRVIHPGVYALGHADLTRHQRWMAATLTAPDSVLSHASAAACFGFRPFDGSFEVITRPGSGGPRRLGNVLLVRSITLAGHATYHDRIPITTPERTLIDLAPQLDAKALGRALREAIRLGLTTAAAVLAALDEHPARRGTARLKERAERYAGLPYHRTRSDAESRALEILHDAGNSERPRVNVRIAGQEADLVFPKRREIIEIDGPQYHRFPDEDERKRQRWEAAGFTVRRIPSDAVYDA